MDSKAVFLLNQMYLASGGDHWSQLGGVTATGKYNLSGLVGSFHRRIDLKEGRDVLTYDVGVTREQQERQRDGSWWQDEKGYVTIETAPDALADAATQSYIDRNGWFHPNRSDRPIYQGSSHQDGKSFELVQLSPPGGRTLTLWIDSSTHLLDRVTWIDAQQRRNTISFSGYRQIRGVLFPCLQTVSIEGTSSGVTMSEMQIQFSAQVEEKEFAPPPSSKPDFHLLPGDVNMPFTIKGGMIVVNVSVNNNTALPFVLDSGALNVLTPDAAKKLHLSADGDLHANGAGNDQVSVQLTHVKSMQIGPAELFEQRFLVASLPLTFTDNGKSEAIAGLLGYEIFRRFVVKIDYYNKRITLLNPAYAHKEELGARIPLLFNGRDCFIAAAVNGTPGIFGIDTGDDGALTLFGAYYSTHNFPIQNPGIEAFQGGVGGSTSTLLSRVASLSIGPFTLLHPLTELHFATGGAFSSELVSGNLGSQIFRNFVLTFDYEHQSLYLNKSPEFGYDMPYNRSGIHLDLNDEGAVIVVGVNKGSPGELAGIKEKDRIIAVDNQFVGQQLYSELEKQLFRPAGSHIAVSLLRDGKQVNLVLTLKELLPIEKPFKVRGLER